MDDGQGAHKTRAMVYTRAPWASKNGSTVSLSTWTEVTGSLLV